MGNTQIPGTWNSDAYYSGDTNFVFDYVTTGLPSLAINPATSTTTLTLSQASVAVGGEDAETFSTTVTPQYPRGGRPARHRHGRRVRHDAVHDHPGVWDWVLRPDRRGQLGTGSYQVTASYRGDYDYAGPYSTNLIDPSTSAPSMLTIATSSSTTALSLSAARVAYGDEDAAKFTATVTPPDSSAGTPAGTVTVAESGTTLCTITLASGTGTCSMKGILLRPGSYQLRRERHIRRVGLGRQHAHHRQGSHDDQP